MAKKKPGARRPAKGKVAEPPKVYELANPPHTDWRAALRELATALKTVYGDRLKD